jgi:hypothetical protein
MGGAAGTHYLVGASFEEEIGGTVEFYGGSDAELSTERSRSGEGSLKLTQDGIGAGASVEYDFPAVTEGDLYARGWVFLPHGSVAGRINLLTFEAEDDVSDVNITPQGSVDVYLQPTGTRTSSPPSAYPYGEWFCLQVHHHVHPTEGFVVVYVGGEEVVKTQPQDTYGEQGVSSVRIGLIWTEGGQTSGGVVYWDDFAVDTESIPCE